MLKTALQKYQGGEYDDSSEFGEGIGTVEVSELYFFNYVANKPEKLKYYYQVPMSYVLGVVKE